MKDVLRAIGIVILILLLFLLWSKLISWLMSGSPDYPFLRARFGTMMWHSSDVDGVYRAADNDPAAQDHLYCYYPKSSIQTKLIIKRVDNLDSCRGWEGIVIIREAPWVSEREKYWWN